MREKTGRAGKQAQNTEKDSRRLRERQVVALESIAKSLKYFRKLSKEKQPSEINGGEQDGRCN